MDAETYLQQIRRMRHTVEGIKLDIEECRAKADMLKGLSYDGMPKGTAEADVLAEMTARMDGLMDAFEREFQRWQALYEQGCAMMQRARDVVCDGYPHAVDLDHVEIVHRYYILGQHRQTIADALGFSISRTDERKRECLDWLDHARDADGYPIVPLVSE